MQSTIRTPVVFEGHGLHTGKPARVVVRPAAANSGIAFRRVDIALGESLLLARWDLVEQSPLCTKLVNRAGVSVSTIEHLMAALAGCGVHNATVDIDGPEVPILDGSAAPFVRGILQAGVRSLGVPVQAIEVLHPIEVHTSAGWARLSPARGLLMDFHIQFEDRAIGRQSLSLNLANGAFVRELCDSRTFCRQADVDAMQAVGLALGGKAGENAVVFDGDAVVSPGGLRHDNEPVRHKMLDAVGDLALAGAPLLAHYEGHRAGHAMTNSLLRELFASEGAYRVVTCDAATAARLPGVGLSAQSIPEVA